MKKYSLKGSHWDDRLNERWQELPGHTRNRLILYSLMAYAIITILVLGHSIIAIKTSRSEGYGTILNPFRKETQSPIKQ